MIIAPPIPLTPALEAWLRAAHDDGAPELCLAVDATDPARPLLCEVITERATELSATEQTEVRALLSAHAAEPFRQGPISGRVRTWCEDGTCGECPACIAEAESEPTMSTPSRFAPTEIVVILRAPSALPCLARLSATPIADAHSAGLGRWLPDATGGVVRITASEDEIDAIEHEERDGEPVCVTWGEVNVRAAREVAA